MYTVIYYQHTLSLLLPAHPRLMVGNGDHGLGGSQRLGQGRVHRQHSVLAERGANGLGVHALGQQELAIVLAVHALRVRLLLVLGVHQQLLVDRLHHDLLGRVLAHVEAQLQHLAVALVLDQRRTNVLHVVGTGTLLRQGCVVVGRTVVVAGGGGAA